MSASESIFAKFLDVEKEPVGFDPTTKLIEWITTKWQGNTIALRDIYRGPSFLQNDRENAFKLAKVLVEKGILVPLKPHRRDRRLFHIVRQPV
jgi:hypothetical protein